MRFRRTARRRHASAEVVPLVSLAMLVPIALQAPLAAAAPDAPAAASQFQVARSAVGKTGRSGRSWVMPYVRGNPLSGRRWGVYKGPMEQAWGPYENAVRDTRRLLARIALAPKTKWFGAWIPPTAIRAKVEDYVATSQAGDRDALVQMAMFAMTPWESEACTRLPTAAEAARYKRWNREAAAGLGNAHVALILQPDGPFAECVPGSSKGPSNLIAYAAKVYSQRPNTSVYIDAGASDWLRDDPARALRILRPAGIWYARGFAFNTTHYVSTAREVRFAAAVSRALARAGMPGKRAVINTSSNGRPFAGYAYDGPEFDHARVCASKTDRRCVTLGIPPTVDVGNPRWRLRGEVGRLAEQYVDAFLWIGRPWLFMQADPFLLGRALQLVRTTPY